MLQQTTVAAVVPYYERFLRRFPTVATLAASEESAVLGLWSGLGYYSRARNLRLAAQLVVRDHGGVFPRDPAVALGLPGIGPYAANAITSIAHGARVAVVDGNVRRVLSRLFAIRALGLQQAQGLASELLSVREPGRWNEAMMELGATICTPRAPKCGTCPVAVHCKGWRTPERWGQPKRRKPPAKTIVHMAFVLRGDHVLLQENPRDGLMGGLFEFPNSGVPGAAAPSPSWRKLHRRAIEIDTEPLFTIRHTITHHQIQAFVFKGRLKTAPPPGLSLHPIDSCGAQPLGGLTRKALKRLEALNEGPHR